MTDLTIKIYGARDQLSTGKLAKDKIKEILKDNARRRKLDSMSKVWIQLCNSPHCENEPAFMVRVTFTIQNRRTPQVKDKGLCKKCIVKFAYDYKLTVPKKDYNNKPIQE